LDVRMHLLATGRYLTLLGSQVLQYNSERWSLKRLPIDLGVPEMPFAIFTLKNRTLSPVAELFIAQVKSLAKSDLRM
jgi:DNA-binding transcriptional LysR family regulator